MDLTESIDEFEVFNQPSSPKNLPDKMGIQRKPQRSLQELLESQPGRGESRKSAQPRLPPPPLRSPPRAPQPTLPSRTEQVDPKKRRERKGKDIIETRRPRLTSEEEAHRAAKQQKLAMPPAEEQKGQTASSQSLRHGFQLPCLVVSPRWMMHQSRTSMEALGITSPRLWSKLFCFPKIWWSCEVLGGMRSSFTPKDFWAWYVLILPCYFSLSFFFFFLTHNYQTYTSILLIWCNTNSSIFVSRLSKIHSGSRR